MEVKQKYLRNENQDIISPITNLSQVIVDGGYQIENSGMAGYSELVFCGKTDSKTISNQNTFTSYNIDTVQFDKYGCYKNGLYVIPKNGWYSIYVTFRLENLVGVTSYSRNINLGICINKTPQDSMQNGRWVQQPFDRCGTSYSIFRQISKGDTVSFQYYVDGSIAKKILSSEIFIIKENQYEVDSSLIEGNISAKMLKDEKRRSI